LRSVRSATAGGRWHRICTQTTGSASTVERICGAEVLCSSASTKLELQSSMARQVSGMHASMCALSSSADLLSSVVCWCSNASYFGAIVFLVNAIVSLIGWRAYRHEVTEMLGFERQLLPSLCISSGGGGRGGSCFCRWCNAVDWLGLAAMIFLAGAALDLVDDFIGDPPAQAWVRTAQ